MTVSLPPFASLATLRRHLSLPGDHRCVFVSGSLVSGWGHATSDVDCYVVGGTLPDRVPTAVQGGLSIEPSARPTYVFRVEGTRFDVECWSEAQVESLLRRCHRSPDEDAPLPFTAEDVDFLYRLGIGVAIDGGSWLADRQLRLRSSDLRAILLHAALDTADGLLDDTLGLLEAGDERSATLSVRAAYGRVVDALLIRAGELSPSVKWRARRVLAVAPPELAFDEYWDWETMRGYDPDRPSAWIEALVERCRELMMGMET